MNRLEEVYDAVWESGAPYGIANFGAYAVDSLRLEKAYKGIGAELTNEITPVEADLLRFARGDGYAGQSALEIVKQRGPNVRIAYLELLDPDGADVIGGESVFHEGRDVGVTTSGGFGHFTGRSLFFAYVPPDLTAPGQELSVMVLGEMRRASVLGNPAHDPANLELRA